MEAKKEIISEIFAAYKDKCTPEVLTKILKNKGMLVRVNTLDKRIVAGKVSYLDKHVISVIPRAARGGTIIEFKSIVVPVENIALIETVNDRYVA